MLGKIRKTVIAVVAVAGLLSVAAIWRQSQDRERGIEVAVLPHFELGEVDGVVISRGQQRIILEKRANGWFIQNSDKIAAEDKILDLLNNLQKTRLGEVVAESANRLEAYEINDDRATVVTLLNGQNTIYRLLFGKRGKDGVPFLRQPESSHIFRGIDAPLHLLRLDEISWRETRLFKLAPEQVTALQGLVDGSSFTLHNDGGSFTIEADDKGPNYRLDQQRAMALVRNISMLRAIGFNDEKVGPIENPDSVFNISTAGGSRTLVIGRDNGKGQHEAVVQGISEVFLLPVSGVNQVHRTTQLLRDLRLFNISLDEVTGAKIGGKEQFFLIRGEDGNFMLDGQTDDDFNTQTANRLVRTLVNLRGSNYDGSTDELELGAVTREFGLNTANGWHYVRLGENDNQGNIKASGDYPGIYGLAPLNLQRFEGGLEMFHAISLDQNGQINYENLQKLPPDVQQQILEKIRARQQ